MTDWAGTGTLNSGTTAITSSYITTVEDLEAMIGSDLRAGAIALKAATDAVQIWACQEATRHIDALPLRGERYEPEHYENGAQTDTNGDGLAQTLAFPRIIDGVVQEWDHATSLPIVPDLVKWACLEEAIAIYAAGAGGIPELQAQGIQAFSVGGKLSYTFVSGAGSQVMQSTKAKEYLRRYIGGKIR